MKAGIKTSALSGLAIMAMLGIANRLDAAAAQPPRPEAFERVIACRAISDSAQRLACYDAQVGAMDGAVQKDELVILDKAEVKKTQRSLFGFSLPRIPFLGRSDDGRSDPERDVTEINEVIDSARAFGSNEWTIKLKDGSEWRTTDSLNFILPKSGMSIHIERGALGSFRAKINGGSPVKVKRIG